MKKVRKRIVIDICDDDGHSYFEIRRGSVDGKAYRVEGYTGLTLGVQHLLQPTELHAGFRVAGCPICHDERANG